MRRVVTVLTLAALFAALPVLAGANDAAIGGVGGAIRPISVADIRMESETVQIIAYEGYAAVRADFKFVNSGEARTVKLGFPFELPFDKQDLNDLPPAAAFRAWQGGKPLEVTYVAPVRDDENPDGIPIGYYVHEATFPPGVTMIRVEYLASPNSSVPTPDVPEPPARYTGMVSSNASYEYWVHTGAGWQGTIGKSVIRFTLSPDFQGWGVEQAQKNWASQQGVPASFSEVALAYKKLSPDTYQWTFSDYEPLPEEGQETSRYDVSLHYFQPNYIDEEGDRANRPEWPPDRVTGAEASSHLKLDPFEYVPEAAFWGVAWPWAEGAEGSGTGEWVKADFAGERDIAEIRVLPGYAKSPALFAKYNRPKTLTVEFSDGTKKTLELEDTPSLQTFKVKAKAKWAKVTIGEVYRGTTRDETYLSLVDFGKAPSPAFESYEAVMGLEEAEGEKDEKPPAETGPTADGRIVTRAIPVWVWIAAVVFAGFVGLAVLGGLVFLLMRKRKA